MNRKEFIEELRRLLAGMPEEEMREAVQYYEDYFADAGEENEEQVLRELGGAEKVAASIRAEYYGTEFHEEDYSQKAYPEKYGKKTEQTAGNATGKTAGQNQGGAESGSAQESSAQHRYTQNGENVGGQTGDMPRGRTNTGVKILLILLIAIAAVPFLGSLASGILCTVLGIICAVIGVFAGLVIGAATLAVAGILMIAAGIPMLFDILPAAVLVIGIGMVLFAVGLAATAGAVKLCAVVYPAMFKGIISLCRRPFYGKAVKR